MAKFNIKAQPIPTVASAYADILGTTENQIVEIKNELIIEDNKQHFQIHEDTIEQLAERIAKDGQLSPCIVVPLSDGKYELIDGRHRRRAVIKAGLPTTKCIIKTNLTDKEKQTIRLTSNLIRNNDYLPSELAFAYKELAELEDMKTISEETNLSKKKIYRYIRLTNLIEPLLNRVDGGSIPVIAAVELSYLTEQQQKKLFEFLLNHSDCKITTAIARDIKEQPDNLYDVFYAVETTDSLPADDSKLDTEEPAEQESIRKLAEKAVEPYRRQDEASVTHDANSKTDSEESRNRNSRVQPQEVDNLSACCGSQRAFGEQDISKNLAERRVETQEQCQPSLPTSVARNGSSVTLVDNLSTQEEDKKTNDGNSAFPFEKDEILYQDLEGNPHSIKEIDDAVLKHICEYVIEETKTDYYVFRFAYDARDILNLWKKNQIRSYHGSTVSERDEASGEIRISADWNYSSKHVFRIEIEGQFYIFLHTMLEKTVRCYLRENYSLERIQEVIKEQ